MLEKLSQIICDFIKETEIIDIEKFTFTDRLIQIFERNYKYNKIKLYENKIPFKKSYRYSYDFLNSINSDYAEYLKNSKDEIIFLDEEETTAYTIMEEDKNKICVPLQNTIADSYVLTHETIHAISFMEDYSPALELFCEALAFLIELLQEEYFKDKKIKGYKINRDMMLSIVYEAVQQLKIKIQLISICLNRGIITIDDMTNIYRMSEDKEITEYVISDIIEQDGLSIADDERYIIGIIFAYYMLDRIHTKRENINEFFELNQIINDYSPEDLVEYLELDISDEETFTLTEESYQKLEESFVKILKDR